MGSNCCKSSEASRSVSARVFPSKFENDNDQVPDSTIENIMDQSSIRPISWRMGKLIGQGGYGKVFQGMDLYTGELLAIKIIDLSSDPLIADRQINFLRQEIQLLKTLKHKNIVRYFQTDINLNTKSVYMVLEYITGGTLKELLAKYGGFSENIIRSYTSQILKGLVYLHSKGLVHMDLKSANILVTEEAVLKISDFGCSRRLEEGRNLFSVKGSPCWMAPEVAMGQDYGSPCDIWSLGCLIIEMATGRLPWSEVSTKPKEITKALCTQGRLPRIPQLSAELRDLVTLCLSRDPASRPTASQLLRHRCIASYSISCSHSFVSKNSTFLGGDMD